MADPGPPEGPPPSPGWQPGYPPPGYPPSGYPPPEYPAVGYPRRTNPFAIAAIVSAFVIAPLGIVFGILARNQIKQTGEDGWGLAQAGLIIGSVFTAFGVLWFMFVLSIVLTAASHAH